MLETASGNDAAFEKIVEKYKKLILNVAFRYLKEKSQAEDAAQEVFVKIYNSAENYKPKAKLSTWIYRIAVNHCFNIIRDTKKHKTVSINSVNEIPNSKEAGPQASMEQTEMGDTIKNAVNALPKRQQTAVILSKYEKLAYKEIAAIMNISVSAVDSLLQRAKENLKIHLEPYFKN